MGGAVCDLKTGTAKHGEVEPIFLKDQQQLFGHLELKGQGWKLVLLLVVPKRDRTFHLYHKFLTSLAIKITRLFLFFEYTISIVMYCTCVWPFHTCLISVLNGIDSIC